MWLVYKTKKRVLEILVEMYQNLFAFRKNSWLVENGRRISFWDHVWIGNQTPSLQVCVFWGGPWDGIPWPGKIFARIYWRRRWIKCVLYLLWLFLTRGWNGWIKLFFLLRLREHFLVKEGIKEYGNWSLKEFFRWNI